MSPLYFLIGIPSFIVLFFFITLTWSYVSYKRLKVPPSKVPQTPEVIYWNNKVDYYEDIGISVGFIVIFVLIAILVAIYKIMLKK